MNTTSGLINRPIEVYLIILFIIVLLLVLLNSLFLNYHWKEYGYNPQGIKTGRFVYCLGLVVIVATTLTGLIIYISR